MLRILLASLLLAASLPAAVGDGQSVLFVGNSHSIGPSGEPPLWQLVEAIAAADGITLTTAGYAQPGYDFSDHLSDPSSLAAIAAGYDLVVLQGYSDEPVEQPEEFETSTAAIVAEVAAAGSESALLMTWTWKTRSDMTQAVADAYTQRGLWNGVDAVAPVGLGFQHVIDERPALEIFSDFKHANIVGHYLSGLITYGSITGMPVVTNSYLPAGVDTTTADYIHQVAQATLDGYHLDPHQESVEIVADDSPYGYLIYRPVGYASFQTKPYPLLIYLGGLGERGNGMDPELTSRTLRHGPPRLIAGLDGGDPWASKGGRHFPAIVLSPQTATNSLWEPETLDEFVEYAKRTYRVDEDRIYMTGLSDGGRGINLYVDDYAHQLAAIMPIATSQPPAYPERLTNLKIWAFHNYADGSHCVTNSTGGMSGVSAALSGDPSVTALATYPFSAGGLNPGCSFPVPEINPNKVNAPYSASSTLTGHVVDSLSTPSPAWSWTSGTVAPHEDDWAHPGNGLLLTVYRTGGHNAWTGTWRKQKVWDWLFAQERPHSKPFAGAPVGSWQRIEAEHFDLGGQSIAYSDADTANTPGAFRPGEGVDIEATADIDGTYDVIASAGEWLHYTVEATTPGSYALDLRVASASGATFSVEVDGVAVAAPLVVPATGGDQVWTTVTVPDLGLAGGIQALRLGIDAGAANINWLQLKPTELIVDNTDLPYVSNVGTWLESSSAPGYHGVNYAYSSVKGVAGDRFTFTPNLPRTGWYELYYQHPADPSRAVVPIDIDHADGLDTVNVDERVDGGVWKPLGAYRFEAGLVGSITVRNDGYPGWVVADAIKLVPVDAEPLVDLIVDNLDDAFVSEVGTWAESTSAPGYYDEDYAYAPKGVGGLSFTWSPNLPKAGIYEVFMYHPADSGRAAAPVDVVHLGGTDTVVVNMKVNGGVWESLGIWEFAEGEATVTIRTDGTSGYVCADAIRFTEADELPPPPPNDHVIDNLDPVRTTAVGSWSHSTGAPGYYSSDYQYAPQGVDGNSFTFTPDLPVAGIYEVYMQHPSDGSRAAAPVDIAHADGVDTVVVNMKEGGGDWKLIGTYIFEAGTAGNVTVRTDGTSGYVCADAVRFVETDELPPPPPNDFIIDNLDPVRTTSVGDWGHSTDAPGYYSSDYQYPPKGVDGYSFTFTPDIPAAGNYEIFIWHPADANRDAAVPVDIVYDGQTYTTVVDMTVEGGAWRSLGIYALGAGSVNSVVVRSDGTSRYVVADAVRFAETAEEPPEPDIDLIIDNEDDDFVTTVGEWRVSTSAPGYYDTNYAYGYPKAIAGASFSFTPIIPLAGAYEVFIRHPADAFRDPAVPVDVVHADGTDSFAVDMTTGGATWKSLGVFAFDNGQAGSVVVRTDGTTEWACADAVRFTWVPSPAN